jgi:hypothetical protein
VGGSPAVGAGGGLEEGEVSAHHAGCERDAHEQGKGPETIANAAVVVPPRVISDGAGGDAGAAGEGGVQGAAEGLSCAAQAEGPGGGGGAGAACDQEGGWSRGPGSARVRRTLDAHTPRHQGKRSRRIPGPGLRGCPPIPAGPCLRPWSSGSPILRCGGVLR